MATFTPRFHSIAAISTLLAALGCSDDGGTGSTDGGGATGAAATGGTATGGSATGGDASGGVPAGGAGSGGMATGGAGTAGDGTGGEAASAGTSGGTAGAGTGGGTAGAPSGGSSGSPPTGGPGTIAHTTTTLPNDEPTACEWEWTIRSLHYHPGAVVPRRMYMSGCNGTTTTPTMFTSLTIGQNAAHPTEDPSSGAIIESVLNPATGALDAVRQVHFPECISMHGIATSADCSTVAALCRIPSGTTGFTADSLATHNAADWMTNPYVCGDRGMNDEMWLYEWKDGDITGVPDKYIVHKSIGSWEYGNNYLVLGENDNTYGIAMKTTVGGENGSDTCHEADAYLVLDRTDYTMTNRAWSWACGTGHTTANRPAYDPTTQKYAMLCCTDYNEDGVGGLGAFYFRMEDGDALEFHYKNLDGIKEKGTASALIPKDGGGFLGVIVGVPGTITPDGYPDVPPTEIGLVNFDATGNMQGGINWVVQQTDTYLSYSNLVPLGPDRYLLGWGVMKRLGTDDDTHDLTLRVPWEYYVMEINSAGDHLTQPQLIAGAGWGDMDQMVPLGDGRVGWAYIPNPAITGDYNVVSCNQPELQLSVYQSN